MPRNPLTFLTLPLELRLEIYTHLLVIPPPPPPEEQQPIYRCSYPYSPPSSPEDHSQPDKPLLHPEILAVNGQINVEATPLLYSRNTFSANPTDPSLPPSLYRPSYLSPPSRPITTTLNPDQQQQQHRHPKQHLIKRWHLRLRLDTTPRPTPIFLPPPLNNPSTISDSTSTIFNTSSSSTAGYNNNSWTKAAITSYFSHAEDLTLCLWTGTFMGGVGADALRQFEGVRGVRRVRVTGVLPGFEGYVSWLTRRMTRLTTRMTMESQGQVMGKVGGDGVEWNGDERKGEGGGKIEEEEYVPIDEREGKRLRGWV
ncbi:hypothetical protein N657DRAFT_657255 [Parathielavia appendiculata]|uniref:Uncharacterized protein n=1 Tax=Parathielavia appendiculata TaxID=2587402 RepID=A0AAN6Z209_9PEZI|nr:hypothetical protein N657DRAFT_657255 [Parathielavia appendiculata]